MASKRSFTEAMQEASAEVLGPVGGVADLLDEIATLKGDLADAESLNKKYKKMLDKRIDEIYRLELLVDLLQRQIPCTCDEGEQPSEELPDVICIDEAEDAGSAM